MEEVASSLGREGTIASASVICMRRHVSTSTEVARQLTTVGTQMRAETVTNSSTCKPGPADDQLTKYMRMLTWMMMAFLAEPTSTSFAAVMYRSLKSPLSSLLVASKSKMACTYNTVIAYSVLYG